MITLDILLAAFVGLAIAFAWLGVLLYRHLIVRVWRIARTRWYVARVQRQVDRDVALMRKQLRLSNARADREYRAWTKGW